MFHNGNRLLITGIFSLSIVCALSFAFADEASTGAVSGHILDLAGAPLPFITLTVKDRGLTVTTDEEGLFTLPLPPGTYHLRILDQEVTVTFGDSPVKIHLQTFSQTVKAKIPTMERMVIPGKAIQSSPGQTLTEILSGEADVNVAGMGGEKAVLSIGGFSKHRVLTLINGYRVTGDRRAGSDMGSLIPALVAGAVISRGETGTTHGSQAIGGAIDLALLEPDGTKGMKVGASWGENDDHTACSALYRSPDLTVAAAWDDADTYTTPKGEEENGFFTRKNLLTTFRLKSPDRLTFFDLLWTEGSDVGKPSTSSKTIVYPVDRLGISGVRSFGRHWDFQLGAIYQELETEKRKDGTLKEASTIESYNFHGSILYHDETVRGGVELYTRQAVNAHVFLPDTTSHPLDDAERWEAAPFFTLHLNLSPSLFLDTGGRVQYFDASNGSMSRSDTHPTSFGTLTLSTSTGDYSLGISTTFRYPTLEELFYDGITGRGTITGNPDLDPEEGIQAGFRWEKESGAWQLEASWSIQDVDSYVERIQTQPDYYTYRNVQDVRIQDASIRARHGWLTAGLSWARGEDRDSGDPVDDIPPFKASITLDPQWGDFHPYLHVVAAASKGRPGPNENAIPGYALVDAGLTYRFAPFTLGIKAANLFDQEAFTSADEKAVMAIGRSVIVSIEWSL